MVTEKTVFEVEVGGFEWEVAVDHDALEISVIDGETDEPACKLCLDEAEHLVVALTRAAKKLAELRAEYRRGTP